MAGLTRSRLVVTNGDAPSLAAEGRVTEERDGVQLARSTQGSCADLSAEFDPAIHTIAESDAVLAASAIFIVLGTVAEGAEKIRLEGIALHGCIWLVPEWSDSSGGSCKRPAWMIGLRPGAYRPDLLQGVSAPLYVLSGPIPRAVLEGRQAAGYSVVVQPSVRVMLSGH